MSTTGVREGSLEAPTRHPIDWKNLEFYNEASLMEELERVFDICHGCRRCVSLCQSFPTLFDLVDESETMEVDGVAKSDYWQVVDHCYLCDLCYLTKCPMCRRTNGTSTSPTSCFAPKPSSTKKARRTRATRCSPAQIPSQSMRRYP